MNAEITSLAQARANRSWSPKPRQRDPEDQAEINHRGRGLVEDVISRAGRPKVRPNAACPNHPEQPAGRYGGGDLRCTPCRQGERPTP